MLVSIGPAQTCGQELELDLRRVLETARGRAAVLELEPESRDAAQRLVQRLSKGATADPVGADSDPAELTRLRAEAIEAATAPDAGVLGNVWIQGEEVFRELRAAMMRSRADLYLPNPPGWSCSPLPSGGPVLTRTRS